MASSERARRRDVDAVDAALRMCARVKQFLASADAKDRVVAFGQYAALFASRGEPGAMLNASKGLAQARKPFRVWKPCEAALPAWEARARGTRAGRTALDEAAFYGKAVGMFCYFVFDHAVWATSVGVVADDGTLGQRAQRASLWGWFAGSACGLYLDTNDLNDLLDEMKARGFGDNDGEDDGNDEDEAAREVLRAKARKVFAGLITNSAQTILALALLEKVKMSKRNIGALGMFLSAVNIATMLPPTSAPSAASKPKTT